METPIEIKAGERFTICTRQYSDTHRDMVTALKDILTADFKRMAKEIAEFIEANERNYKSDYQLITAWLVINGYVTVPEFLKELCFHYETNIEQAYIDDNKYDQEEFNTTIELLTRKD